MGETCGLSPLSTESNRAGKSNRLRGSVQIMDAGYRVRELTSDEADEIGRWTYEGRDVTYEFDDGPPDPADGYHAVEDGQGRLVGYCCFGAEARVPGIDAVPGVVDVGYGMRPDLVGQGRGRPFLAAILDHARTLEAPDRFRALVLDWNQRSRATCRNAGFTEVGEATTDQGRFVVLERSARA